ncbi:hypothetical protein [Achromobacter denitrificans]|uniref:hypothetical protein n=1 Tax=Achromobacter denitrificans TaxID=32002 RepID=UPI003B991A13
MTEKARFAVIIGAGTETEKLFADNYDGVNGENGLVLFCSEVDLSGFHAKLVRIPGPGSRIREKGVTKQKLWIPTAHIAAMCEYGGEGPPIGFGDGEA